MKSNKTFLEVLKHEGVVSIVSWGVDEAHVTCTWNSFVTLADDDTILIPAAGMTSIQNDVEHQNRIKLTCGAKEVMGFNDYQGTGFEINGTATFLTEGPAFDLMKAKYPFLTRVLEVKVDSLKQLL